MTGMTGKKLDQSTAAVRLRHAEVRKAVARPLLSSTPQEAGRRQNCGG